MDHLRSRHLLVAIILVVAFSATSAFAGAKVFQDSSLNEFTIISGSYETNVNNNTDPFVIQIFSSGDECVRLEVIRQGADFEMTLISPNGTIWQNDDGGVDTQPLIKAITNVRGWYPLVISQFAGAVANADFDLQYGRFIATSTQCTDPTAPSTALTNGAKTSDGAAGGSVSPNSD
ncbi:MAG: hypothetical protein ETSY1_19105 [Candidatus Entotheonella factor]|uniref:Uncharacterized protein n=1 Tax=Entotheonella factor TaxID=1429438 RepID=W4LLX2_ENTF1|nr:MAG: hypothetical protein ETSY1_19105 [Candidatus Entotheonella factor]